MTNWVGPSLEWPVSTLDARLVAAMGAVVAAAHLGE